MLLQRVVTAVVLLPFVLGVLWFGSTQTIGLVFGAVVLLGAFEWASLTGVRPPPGQPPGDSRLATFLYGLAAALLLSAVVRFHDTPWVWIPVAGTCLWWIYALSWIARFPDGFDASRPPRWLRAGAGLLVLTGTLGAVMLLHRVPEAQAGRFGGHYDALRLFFALVIVWAADIGAYFAGRAFGRRKLAVRVSPGKTWEGAAGGVALALAVAAAAGQWLFGLAGAAWLPFLMLCAIVVAYSIVGDLGESLLKRQVGTKDSGALLPGHGGILDRIDSLTAALPAMALGLHGLGL